MCILKEKADALLASLKNLSLFLLRLVLAYGFYEPAMNKWSDINAVATWFGESLHLPFPLLNAYMAASTELLGVVLLTLGLGVRYISLPLMVVMVVAITTVHLGNGFSAGDNGFEIPLYYLLMLLVLVAHGGGKWGVESYIGSKSCESGTC
jgi:putative oxidoreductase